MTHVLFYLLATLVPIGLVLAIQGLRRRNETRRDLQSAQRTESQQRVLRAYLDDANSDGSLS